MRSTRLTVVCGVICALASGCGDRQTSEAEVAPAARAEAVASGSVAIYDDALAAGWRDWSRGCTRNFAATSPVASGSRSLAVTFQRYGSLTLRRTSSVSGMSSLDLSVNVGTGSGNQLQLRVSAGQRTVVNAPLAKYCPGGTLPRGAWARCSVPLGTLVPAGTAIDGIAIQDYSGRSRPTMYLDAMVLSPGAVPPAVTVAIAPATATLDACGALQLSATVTGADDRSVTWAVREGAAGGAVDASGRYTAPPGGGTYHVVATSTASPSASASTTVTVQERILSVAVEPASSTVQAGGSLQLTAIVTTTCGSFRTTTAL